ncbi:hypothetical protein BSKO_12915 [Bryopsis sp. KO-2023]|nr:hypothetical protein BSKO_12915 [Bryopsis sp. KO-2023]
MDGKEPLSSEKEGSESQPPEASAGDHKPVDAGTSNDNPAEDAAPSAAKKNKKKKSKKKGKKFMPLPVLSGLDEKLPWSTSFTQKMGRFAVARRRISAGEVVLMEHAVAAVPREQFGLVLCSACFKKLPDIKLMSSTDPQQRTFCCAACQEHANKACASTDVHAELPALAQQHECDLALLKLIAELASLKKGRETGGVRQPQREALEGSCELPEVELFQGSNEGKFVLHGGWADVKSLVSHWDKMPESWRKSLASGCRALKELIGKHHEDGDPVDLQELQELAAIINMNSHGLGTSGIENTDVALGLFPVCSLFNHSCRPNCCFSAEGPVMTFRAIRDIMPNEQMCVSYINLMEPRWLRQKTLLETRYFQCACERCSEDLQTSTDRMLEGVQCPDPKCSGLHIPECMSDSDSKTPQWKCTVCNLTSGIKSKKTDEEINTSTPEPPPESKADANSENNGKENEADVKKGAVKRKGGKKKTEKKDYSGFVPEEVVAQAHESLMTAMSVYNNRDTKAALQLFEDHIKGFDGPGKLGPYHVHMFDAMTPIMNCYRRLGDPQGSLKYCQKVITAMETILQIPTTELGNFYKCMGEVLSVRAGVAGLPPAIRDVYKKQAQDALKKAVQVRKICYGAKHPATQETQLLLRRL